MCSAPVTSISSGNEAGILRRLRVVCLLSPRPSVLNHRPAFGCRGTVPNASDQPSASAFGVEWIVTDWTPRISTFSNDGVPPAIAGGTLCRVPGEGDALPQAEVHVEGLAVIEGDADAPVQSAFNPDHQSFRAAEHIWSHGPMKWDGSVCS